MTAYETRNWFADEEIAQDPYPFLDSLRAQNPVQLTPHHGVVAVTGYDEATAVFRDHKRQLKDEVAAGTLSPADRDTAEAELVTRFSSELAVGSADMPVPSERSAAICAPSGEIAGSK